MRTIAMVLGVLVEIAQKDFPDARRPTFVVHPDPERAREHSAARCRAGLHLTVYRCRCNHRLSLTRERGTSLNAHLTTSSEIEDVPCTTGWT